jgi:hypothetical protein
MTHGNFLDELTERVKQTVALQFLERNSLSQLANAAYAYVYPIGLLQARWFFNKSAALSITSNVVAKPADCQKLTAITLTNIVNPLGGFLTKQATYVPLPEWDTVNTSPVQKGTASNPKFREDPTSIYLVPFQNSAAANFTGTIHYLRNFPAVSDETFELSDPNGNALPILPYFLEENAMLHAVKLVKLRASGVTASPSQIAQWSADYQKTMAALKAGEDPLAIWNRPFAGVAS